MLLLLLLLLLSLLLLSFFEKAFSTEQKNKELGEELMCCHLEHRKKYNFKPNKGTRSAFI